jgi:hypothetical protein
MTRQQQQSSSSLPCAAAAGEQYDQQQQTVHHSLFDPGEQALFSTVIDHSLRHIFLSFAF